MRYQLHQKWLTHNEHKRNILLGSGHCIAPFHDASYRNTRIGETMKILIFGLPGSGKTTLAFPLAKHLGGIHINADEVRTKYNDWDFSPEGRMRQSNRMKYLSDGVVMSGRIAITDFVCPTEEARNAFDPDFIIYMDTIKEGRFDDTNKMFQKPSDGDVDYHVSGWYDDTPEKLAEAIRRYREQQVTPGFSSFRKDADGNVFVAHNTSFRSKRME